MIPSDSGTGEAALALGQALPTGKQGVALPRCRLVEHCRSGVKQAAGADTGIQPARAHALRQGLGRIPTPAQLNYRSALLMHR